MDFSQKMPKIVKNRDFSGKNRVFLQSRFLPVFGLSKTLGLTAQTVQNTGALVEKLKGHFSDNAGAIFGQRVDIRGG